MIYILEFNLTLSVRGYKRIRKIFEYFAIDVTYITYIYFVPG